MQFSFHKRNSRDKSAKNEVNETISSENNVKIEAECLSIVIRATT